MNELIEEYLKNHDVDIYKQFKLNVRFAEYSRMFHITATQMDGSVILTTQDPHLHTVFKQIRNEIDYFLNHREVYEE